MKSNKAQKLAQAKQKVLRSLNFGMGSLCRKMYAGGHWQEGVKKQELRALLTAPGYLLIFIDRSMNEYQVVKYVSTPAGWPTEEVRYAVPVKDSL